MMEEILEIKEHQSCVWKVRWGDFRNGNLLATCSVDSTIRIWKIYKCQKELRYQYEMLYKYGGEYSINSIDWSPISLGTKIAGCDSEGNLLIVYKKGSQWEFFKNQDIGITEPLNAVVWAPNFEINPKEENQCLLLTGGCDGFIYIYNFEQKDNIHISFLHRIQAHNDWIRDISFSPNVHLKYYTFATASEDKNCIIWKLFDTKEFLTEKQKLDFDSPVWRVSWNFTGHLLSVGYTSAERKNMVSIYSENQDGVWEQVKSLNN